MIQAPSSRHRQLLVEPQDPPPASLLNPQGRSTLLLVCDHASNAVPTVLGDLGVHERERARHIAWDIGAATVTRMLSRRFDAPAVLAGFSRLVIDCNRPPGDPTSIPEVSDGTLIPANRGLDEAAMVARIEEIFWPYHQAVSGMMVRMRCRSTLPVLVAVHSFTPVMAGFRRPWHIGVLWDRDPRIARPLLHHLRGRAELVVGDNEPYSGREVGFTMDTHAGCAGLPHVELEIRQDLLADETGCRRWADIVGDALDAVLAEASPFEITHF